MLRVAVGPVLLGCVMATGAGCGSNVSAALASRQPGAPHCSAAVAGCGSNGSGALASLQPGVPHCSAAETAAARLKQSEQQNPAVSAPSPSGTANPPPVPTTGSPPPTSTPMPTAIPTVVAAATLKLEPAELSRDPSAQYVIRVGTVIDVELPDVTAPFCWSIPTSSAASVLEVAVQGDDLGGGAHARFRAIAPGVATIATTNACYTFPPCGAPVALTEAVVTVRA